MVEIRHDGALGDLETDICRIRPGVIEAVHHELEEFRVAERLARDVDGDAAVRRQLHAAAPSAESTAWTTQRSTSGINR